MADVFPRTLHHLDDGAFLCLHGAHLQRLLLQVPQYIWLWVERKGHVHKSAMDVCYQYEYTQVFFVCCITLHVPFQYVQGLIDIHAFTFQKQNSSNKCFAYTRP